MNKINLIKTTLWFSILFSTLTLFNSCKRDTVNPGGTTFDNTMTAQASIFGQVIGEDGNPIKDAVVHIGVNSYTTNDDGVFYFSKITTQQNATLVTVNKTNYMTGYRTLLITPNKDHYTRIMLIELKSPSSFNSISGGMINVQGGGTITFPADAIVYKSNGTPYSGKVNVFAKWLDPTSSVLNQLMPGDLRGINTSNMEKILATFGMMAVEMFDDAGVPLQIGNGKSAGLSFPIPASLNIMAPNSIPLWFFDTLTGMWKEEGSASKQGGNYVGDVKHFSFWNCDYPSTFVNVNLTLQDSSGSPLANMMVKITNTSTGLSAYGNTNSSGYVAGLVPDNSTLLLEVIAPSPCNNVIYSQSFTTAASPLSLGIIVISIPPTNAYTISGMVTDCFSNPVSNGFVSIVAAGNSILVPTNSSGGFSCSMFFCSTTVNATVTAYDISSAVNGNSTVTLAAGNNNLGSLVACGVVNQFIHWTSTVGTISTNYAIDEPLGTFSGYYNIPSMETSLYGYASGGVGIGFLFDGPDNAISSHNLLSYYDHVDSIATIPSTIPVNITNYQPTPGFVEGSFTGVVNGVTIPSRTITCTFRVKHQ